MKNKTIIVVILVIFIGKVYSQDFYGINGFGKLTLQEDYVFYFHYFDCGIDSGLYNIKGDTLFLNSFYKPVQISQINKFDEGTFYFNTNCSYAISCEEEDGSCCDTFPVQTWNIAASVFRMDSTFFNKDDMVDFWGLSRLYRRIIWPSDTIKSAYIQVDTAFGRRVYFENYPLLIRDGYLLPFKSNNYFRRINKFIFLPMKRGKKDLKYEVYLSGFGKIY